MDRRTLIVGVASCLVTAPRSAAQQARKVPRIGWLGGPTRESAEPFLQAFQRGLKDFGWVEGRNLVIEWRFADGHAERLPTLAAELVRLGVDLIVVPSTPTALAAKHATTTIPLVTVGGGDPVGLGLVASLARPGGNVTGLTSVVGAEIAGKQLTLLKEIAPKASTLAVLWNPATRGNALALAETKIAARGQELQVLEARTADDLPGAFASMSAKPPGALLVLGDVLFLTHRSMLTHLAARSRVPAMYVSREYVEAGGLMSYGPVLSELFRRAAAYVDKILKGAKAGDLPVERPTKFELVISRKAAAELGVKIPESLLLRADDVIP
jgi:putative ABC transport system substrate-binding protein